MNLTGDQNNAQDASDEGIDNAAMALGLFAVDPVGLGGVALRSLATPARDHWLTRLRALLPAQTPLRRVPLSITDERLLGGLDLAATLRSGKPVAQRGVLAEAHQGVLILTMAERISAATAARMAAVLDLGESVMERDGLALRQPAQVGIVALDEGMEPDEILPARLLDRLAFHVELQPRQQLEQLDLWQTDDILAARALLPQVVASDEIVHALCAAAQALGVASLRGSLLAVRAACVAAALDARTEVQQQDASLAAQLVLGPRATQIPTPPADAPTDSELDDSPPEPPPEPPDAPTPPEPPDSPNDDSNDDQNQQPDIGELQDLVLAAAAAAIPAGLLAALKVQQALGKQGSGGKAGALQQAKLRGRPIGARRGEPGPKGRLNLIETLRAAAPWQTLRNAQVDKSAALIQVRREDFHITRYKQRSETTAIFVVDASGSSALNRLAEAKGAVELLLADCYVRRDQVAVLAFRGRSAELLLPPTRSLVRAKRSLAGLPGGGGTPLASGIEAALALADSIRRKGQTPVIVLLTDGRANISRDGAPGRQQAALDATNAGRQVRLAGFTSLLLDTAPTSQATARELATQMDAIYLPLPYAGAATLSQVVKSASAAAGKRG
jgi:magnesium chelatase subunit D